MPSGGSHSSSASRRTSGLLRLPGKRRMSTSSPIPASTSAGPSAARSRGPWPTVSSGIPRAYPEAGGPARRRGRDHARSGQAGALWHARRVSEAVETVRTSLWRSRGMQALIGVTFLGFASYCLTLASLPVYAVQGGADESTAGVVTAVFLVVTIAVQVAIPALTARFGVGRVLVAGLIAMGVPSPFYVLDDGLAWICALSAVRGAGFAVLTVLGATLAAQVAPPERRGESIGLYGLAIAIPNLVAVPAGAALVLGGHVAWLSWLAASPVLGALLVPLLIRSIGPQPGPGPAGSGRAAVLAALAPSAVLFVVTMAGGGLVTFLPIERPDGVLATVALLVFGVTGAVTRWRAGTLADRLGTGRLLPSALAVAAAGLVITAA